MSTSELHDAGAAAANHAERRWAILVGAIVAMLLAMMAYMVMHWATMPPARMETIDPGTLHLAGEFTEDNLGSAMEADGSVTVRVLANQYAFTPACLLVPADTPVNIRGTSADVVHGFSISNTNVNVMLVPGYIASVKARFTTPADLVMPCHEFCGTGHADMWAHVKVIDKAAFIARSKLARRTNCVGE
jgi:cytochrome c oxidase subunit 2